MYLCLWFEEGCSCDGLAMPRGSLVLSGIIDAQNRHTIRKDLCVALQHMADAIHCVYGRNAVASTTENVLYTNAV